MRRDCIRVRTRGRTRGLTRGLTRGCTRAGTRGLTRGRTRPRTRGLTRGRTRAGTRGLTRGRTRPNTLKIRFHPRIGHLDLKLSVPQSKNSSLSRPARDPIPGGRISEPGVPRNGIRVGVSQMFIAHSFLTPYTFHFQIPFLGGPKETRG